MLFLVNVSLPCLLLEFRIISLEVFRQFHQPVRQFLPFQFFFFFFLLLPFPRLDYRVNNPYRVEETDCPEYHVPRAEAVTSGTVVQIPEEERGQGDGYCECRQQVCDYDAYDIQEIAAASCLFHDVRLF